MFKACTGGCSPTRGKRALPWILMGVVSISFSIIDNARTEEPDPDFGMQWGLQNTGQVVGGQRGVPGADVSAPAAWTIHAGTSSVIVAIIGGGINPHMEFADRLLEGHATLGDPFNTLDTCPGDTLLAGIIAADGHNGVGIAGLNSHARLLPVRVSDGCVGTQQSAADGIVWAVDHGADIILAAVQFVDGSPALADAVAFAAAHDVLIVAPAGHSDPGHNEVSFPAAYDGSLAVSATTNRDELSTVSNYGSQVDLAAPGRHIWSTWVDGGYAFAEKDTFAAAAFVAGVASLIRSYAPAMSAADVAQMLKASVDDIGPPGVDPFFGAGRINAFNALQLTIPPIIRFEYVEPLPMTVIPGATGGFIVRLAAGSESVRPGSARLFSPVGSLTYNAITMTPLGHDLYWVRFPSVPCRTTVDYFLLASGDGPTGDVVTDPLNLPGPLHTVTAVARQVLFADDFESDRGWTVEVEGGAATTGIWTRVVPVGTSAQPGFDYSPDTGTFCYVTGQHFGGNAGTNDVDNGPVRLVSPVVTLPTADAEISYARWFSSSGVGQEDFLSVEFSRDGGTTWNLVETVVSTNQWVLKAFRLRDFPQISGDRLRVRFSTADSPNDSLTEAAVDEFRVRAIRCTLPPGDVDANGVTDLVDYKKMNECWTGPVTWIRHGSCAPLDIDDSLHVDLADFARLQNSFGG